MRARRDQEPVEEGEQRRDSVGVPARRWDDALLLHGLPIAAGNHAVARFVTAGRAAVMRRPLPAQTSSTQPGEGVVTASGPSPVEVAGQLGQDYDADHPAALDAGATSSVPAALARLDGLKVSEMITALQVLRLNGSPAAPGSRAAFQWIVANRAAATPRTQAAIAAIAQPAGLTSTMVAGLAADDAREVQAFLDLSSWDDALLGLPRKGTPGAGQVTPRQNDQIEYIRRRRDVVADWGRKLFKNRRGLEWDGSSRTDPTPGGAGAGTLEAEIWRELDIEGGASAVNTYDDQRFSWGKGWSALATLPRIIDRFFTADPGARQELMEAGFTYRAAENAWLFVDVNRGQVLAGNEALDAFKADRKFASLLIHLAEDPEHQQHFVNAQWAELSSAGRAGDVPAAVRKAWPGTWSTQSVRFAAHCVHWGYSWSEAAANGPDIKNLIRWISKKKGTQDASGAWKITGSASATIRHFAGAVAQSQMTGPAPLPTPLDPAAFYYVDGGGYWVWKP